VSLVDTFQDAVLHVPDLLQPVIVAAAGAVPFIEGEGAATIGVLGGIHPVVAAVSGIVGNVLCVALVVLLGSGARGAVVLRRRRTTAARAQEAPSLVPVGGADPQVASGAGEAAVEEAPASSPRREKFQRAFSRWGVPGVSLLGPLLLPTQFTATMLATAGVAPRRILLWQGVAIVGWTTLLTVLASSVLHAVA